MIAPGTAKVIASGTAKVIPAGTAKVIAAVVAAWFCTAVQVSAVAEAAEEIGACS